MIKIKENDDGTYDVWMKDEKPITITDKEFDKLLKETLMEEYPDLIDNKE